MITRTLEWIPVSDRRKPEKREHVLICVGDSFVGEGYLRSDGEWQRYDDLGPVDQYMSSKVTAWAYMPIPVQKYEILKEKEVYKS